MNAKIEAKKLLRSLFRLPKSHSNSDDSDDSIDKLVDFIIQATKDEIRKVDIPNLTVRDVIEESKLL